MTTARRARLLPVLLIIWSGLAGCGAAERASDTSAEPTTSKETAAESANGDTTLRVLTVDPAASGARCMVPTAQTLATQTTAFEGTVTELDDGTATLRVDRWFTGTKSDLVTVVAPDEDLQALLDAVDFEVGRTYLVSASGDRVSLCGFTAEKTPELEAMFVEAFAP